MAITGFTMQNCRVACTMTSTVLHQTVSPQRSKHTQSGEKTSFYNQAIQNNVHIFKADLFLQQTNVQTLQLH